MIRKEHLTPAFPFSFAVLVVFALCFSGLERAKAQTQKVPPRRRAEEPKFEDISLTTRDGMIVECTYYPGPESRETVPMILVHDWDGNRGQFHPIALWMQRQLKLSVITVDLRGHGDSTRIPGSDKPLDREKFKGKALATMMWDIEACKSHLLKMNNEGNLNIEQLGVLGTGFGATLAVKWAIQDWSVRNLPTYKQGWDVKALILASPKRTFKGLTISTELKKLPILKNISTLTMVGADEPRDMSDAKRIYKSFEGAWAGNKEQAKEAAIFYAAPTSLQGMNLLKAPGDISGRMARFIERRLVDRGAQFPWTDRTNPLDR